MGWFDSELARGGQTLDRELVQCLGLFDRPAPWGALLALKAAEPPITGLTEALHDADDRAIAESLARLRQWGLVDCDPAAPEPDLDAHPLVRERFGARLEAERPDAWRAAHRCLFEWFQTVPGLEQPDGLAGLEPLYRAVGHGCRAGLYEAALGVYWDRIRRGDQGYSLFHLGAISADLSALAGFFRSGWSDPPVDTDILEPERTWLTANAAYCLMSLGRPQEARKAQEIVRGRLRLRLFQEIQLVEFFRPQQMAHDRLRQAFSWRMCCYRSENLFDLDTPYGRWREAESAARDAVKLSPWIPTWSDTSLPRLVALARLGRALHGEGRLAASTAAFGEAAMIKGRLSPRVSALLSLDGFDYDQLLLDQARDSTDRFGVLHRAKTSLANVQQIGDLVSQALNLCTIGQSLVALNEPNSRTQVSYVLHQSVQIMRQSSVQYFLPVVLLARAHHHRDRHHPDLAQADLDAALSIARRGNMQTYLADCALLEGHLHLDRLVRPTPAPATAAPCFEPAAADSPAGDSGLPDICVSAASNHPWHRVPASCRNDDQLDRSGLPGPDRAPADLSAADSIPDAARAWAQAHEIIRRTGYGRRETELYLLEARLRHYQGRPDQAREALACAQSRIEAIGQWGLWPRLTQVALELGVQVPERPPQ